MSLSIWSYTFLYLSIIDPIFYQIKMLMLYNVQPTNLTCAGKNEIYSKQL